MQKNSITNKISPCCGLPFSVIYWWVSNLTLNTPADRKYLLTQISQNGVLSIDGWKVLINSGTLEADASLKKSEFLAWFDCNKQPTCEQLKLLIEGYKIGNWTPETELPSNLALIDVQISGSNYVGNVYTKEQTDDKIADGFASGVVGEAIPTTDPPETGFYRYIVHEAGTYTNFGGIVVSASDLEDNMVFLEVTDNVAKKVLIELQDGRSAYEVAVANGFVGTEQEWLDSLKTTPATVLNATNETDAISGKAVDKYLFNKPSGVSEMFGEGNWVNADAVLSSSPMLLVMDFEQALPISVEEIYLNTQKGGLIRIQKMTKISNGSYQFIGSPLIVNSALGENIISTIPQELQTLAVGESFGIYQDSGRIGQISGVANNGSYKVWFKVNSATTGTISGMTSSTTSVGFRIKGIKSAESYPKGVLTDMLADYNLSKQQVGSKAFWSKIETEVTITQNSSHNAFPGICVDDSGNIHVFYRKGTAHESGDGSIAYKYSTDDGLTWSAETIVLSGAELVNGKYRDWRDVSALITKDGKLLLTAVAAYYSVAGTGGSYDTNHDTYFYRIPFSSGSLNFSAKTSVIAPKPVAGYGSFSSGGSLYVGKDIISAIYSTNSANSVYIIKSTDNGATWAVISTTAISGNEVAIALCGEHLLMSVRGSWQTNNKNYKSADFGVTWTLISTLQKPLLGLSAVGFGDYFVLAGKDDAGSNKKMIFGIFDRFGSIIVNYDYRATASTSDSSYVKIYRDHRFVYFVYYDSIGSGVFAIKFMKMKTSAFLGLR